MASGRISTQAAKAGDMEVSQKNIRSRGGEEDDVIIVDGSDGQLGRIAN